MKRLLLTLLLLLASTVWAGPREDAAAANARGDYAAELRITRPLAAKGEAWAQLFLGLSYSNGEGVPKNETESMKWYKLAAAQGNATAQSNLGVIYNNGQGVVQDYTEAAKWFRLAAAQGDAPGQSNLGLMYANGRGVAQDYVRAHMWSNLGAVSGKNENAAKNRDMVAKRMNTQQIAEAQKMARECQARNFKGCD